MRAGQLNRLVQLQQVVMTSDTEGVSSETWAQLGNQCWAHIMPIGAVERFVAGQVEEKITHQVTIRWRPDITEVKARFVYTATPGGTARIFLIHNVLDQDEGHRELDCLCEEVVLTAAGVA